MMRFLERQLRVTVRRPWRLLKLWRLGAVVNWFRCHRVDRSCSWAKKAGTPFYVRDLPAKQYRFLQGSKREHVRSHCERMGARYAKLIEARYAGIVGPRQSVLCLGSRFGEEVDGFRRLGCFAVGIDIAPPKDSPYTLFGDMHSPDFPRESVHVIFTNSLDHSRDQVELVLAVSQVLKSGGLFILEISNGKHDSPADSPGRHETTWWDSRDEVANWFGAFPSLEAESGGDIDYPFTGGRYVFRRS